MNEIDLRTQEIRKARNVTVWMFVLFPFFGAGFAALYEHQSGIARYLALLPIGVYLMTFLYWAARFSYATCPACHGPMFHKYFFFYGFHICVRCGHSLSAHRGSAE